MLSAATDNYLTSRGPSAPKPLSYKALVVRLDHDPTHVMAAIWTCHVRRQSRAALWAIGQLPGFDRVVRPTDTGAMVRVLAFWDSHDCVSPVTKEATLTRTPAKVENPRW